MTPEQRISYAKKPVPITSSTREARRAAHYQHSRQAKPSRKIERHLRLKMLP